MVFWGEIIRIGVGYFYLLRDIGNGRITASRWSVEKISNIDTFGRTLDSNKRSVSLADDTIEHLYRDCVLQRNVHYAIPSVLIERTSGMRWSASKQHHQETLEAKAIT